MASLHLALDAGLRPMALHAGAPVRGMPRGDALQWQARAALPRLAPGQLWLVELPEFAATLWPQERGLIVAANVVIYDRGLAPLVAGALPPGGYAEPAGFPGRSGDPEAVERSRHFIRDGWSVVRLVDAGRASARRAFAERLRADGSDGEAPVQIFVAGDGGGYQATSIALDGVGDLAAADLLGRRVVMLFPAPGAGAAPAMSGIAANGLAG